MAVELSDADVGIAPHEMSDADVGIGGHELSDADVGIQPDLSKVGTSVYDKFKLQELHAPNLPDYPITVPRSMDPNMDFARATGGNPTGKLISGAVDLAGQGLVKIADIPTRLHNIGKTPESPGYVPTLEERTADGKNIINLPRATGTGPVSGALNVISSTAEGVIGRPQSAFMLPLAAGEGAVAKLTGTAFGAQMAAGVPDALNNALQVVSDPNATDAQKTEAIGNPLVQAYFAKKLLGHGMAEPAPPQMQGPLATGEVLQRPKGATPPPLDELSDVSTVPSEGPTFSGIKETDIPKIPKAQVPETAPEAERSINVSEEIRNHGARTVADIQRLFPQAQLTRESARTLRNAAWGEPDANGNLPEPPNRPATPLQAAQPAKPSPVSPIEERNNAEPRQPAIPQTNVTPPVTQVGELPIEESQSQPVPKTIPAGDGTAQETVPAQAVSAPESAPTVTPEPSDSGYGIAERVREERAQSGTGPENEPGKVPNAEESVENGRKMIQQGVDPESALKNFEETGQSKATDIALVRAQGEKLSKSASDAADENGISSPEYEAAKKASFDWEKRTKKLQTDWAERGQAQQGHTDLDTGNFHALARENFKNTGEDFTPKESKTAKKLSDKVSTKRAESTAAEEALKKHLSETANEQAPKIHPKVLEIANRIIDKLDKRADAARIRIKERAGRLSAGIDPTLLKDLAEVGASHIAHFTKDFAEWSAKMVEEFGEWVKPHLQDVFDRSQKVLNGIKTGSEVKRAISEPESRGGIKGAEKAAIDATNKTVRESAAQSAKAESEQRIKANAERPEDVQDKAAQDALDAAHRAASKAATDLAKADSKARVAKAESEKEAAKAQTKAAQKALDAANKVVRDAASKTAASERKAQSNPEIKIWEKVREYIADGEQSFDDIRNKVATDLGISVDKVTDIITRNPRAKMLADEAWKKQQELRRFKEVAKRWLVNKQTPDFQRVLAAVPKSMFAAKVGFHGTVALGTHAPMVAFQPPYWAMYAKNFAKMYKMVGKPEFYERQIQDLVRNKNYRVAREAGLVNDPHTFEDFNSPNMAQYVGKLSGMGNRGYAVLKLLRQDMFDSQWNKLPKTLQIKEMAEAIANGVNHDTGVVKASSPGSVSTALFAPRLLASRVAWLAIDPIKSVGTFINWRNASAADRYFAVNQVKSKAWVFGTMAALLAANQGILNAVGSSQKINYTDPMRSDFLKFKVAGMNASYGNAMVAMARLPARLFENVKNEGKLSKIVYEDERVYDTLGTYGRSQLSPFAGTVMDLATGRDFQWRPLPRAGFGFLPGKTNIPKRLRAQGIKPYTWAEYGSGVAAPIPAQEIIKEVWRHGLGMSDEQIKGYLKAFAATAFDAGTGGRVTDDIEPKKP